MILIRSGFAVAALAAGIVAGFVLYRSPSQMTRLGQEAFRLSSNGNLSAAVETYSEQIRRRPDEYILYLRRGVTQERSGNLAAAVVDFDEALRRIPQPLTADELGPRLFKSGLAETHVHNMAVELHTERAQALEGLGRIDEAILAWSDAIALNGRLTGAIEHRGELRMLTGRLVDARADFDTALDRGTNSEAQFARGMTAYLTGDWTAAAADFKQALRTRPASGTTALWLLKAQLRGHQPVPLDEFRAIPPANAAWPWINAFLGDYDGGSLVTGLRDGVSGDVARACEATHLLGEWFLIKSAPDQAALAFHAAADRCPQLSLPHVASELELKRLAQPAQPVRAIDTRR